MAAYTRDLVVIGCSAGGVEALPRLLSALPTTLEACVCIVQHLRATENPYLVDILRRSTGLPVEWAEQGTSIERGRVFVGPPDVHLLVGEGHLSLVRGPRENHARPAIDKLFRSAAAHYTRRTIGVLLTGMMEDGVGGLGSIRDAGGMIIVQDPEDAAFPELPSRALLALEPDRVLPLIAIPPAIAMLVGQAVEIREPSTELSAEAEIDRVGQVTPSTLDRLGTKTSIPCPDCKGPTWLLGDENTRRYRCYHGHVTSAQELLLRESNEIEAALWSAVRALSDRAATFETLASDSDRLGRSHIAQTYAERAREARSHAELARKFVLDVLREPIPPTR